MAEGDIERRFRVALEQARAEWAAADPAWRATRAGCEISGEGVLVPFFATPHLVTHPGGDVTVGSTPAHAAVAILLLHYLLRADGTPPTDDWVAFRDLPDGLFYATTFARRAEMPLAAAFGLPTEPARDTGLARFRAAAAAAGGAPLGLADAAFAFQLLPRLRMAVLLWAADNEFPAQARVLFNAAAGHYLPTEDLAGLGDLLAGRLASAGA